MLDIYVDGDSCPVKQEVYNIARRCKINVFIVSNSYLETPKYEKIHYIRVDKKEDAADDWIAEHIQSEDICVTSDIPLAARCLDSRAFSVDPRGRQFTQNSIGDDLATRDLMYSLRESGLVLGAGAPPMTRKDRSRFLNKLNQIIQSIQNRQRSKSRGTC